LTKKVADNRRRFCLLGEYYFMAEAAESRTGSTLLTLLRNPADPQAWEAFVDRYTPLVGDWCRQWKLQSADTQEVTQEVLLRLMHALRKFPYDPAKGHFRGWLKTLTHNAWRDLRNRRRRAGLGSGDPHIQSLLEQQEDRNGLAEALEHGFLLELYEEAQARVQLRVSRACWQVFQLLVLEGWSGAEVAAKLQMKLATVYTAKSRVQKMLHEELRKLDPDAEPTPGCQPAARANRGERP
jgi:RNA polymerase sigma-70 factor (ECF subfamily)